MDSHLPPFQELYDYGQTQFREGKFAKLIEYHQKMMQIYDYLIKHEYSCRIFWDLARCYEYYHDFTAATYFYENAIEYWTNIPNDTKRHLFHRLGYCTYRMRAWRKSLFYFSKAGAIYHHLDDQKLEEECQYCMACVYLKLNQPHPAMQLLEKVLPHNFQLKQEAKKDEDLVTLQDQAEFERLLDVEFEN